MDGSRGGSGFDVAIIGAGPAGLTAAYLLTKAGKSVLVFEKDETYVGGISRTVSSNGYRFDMGGHRFFSKSQEVVALWREILPDGFIERPRLSRIYYGGRFYSYPLRAFEALRNLGVLESALCALSYLRWRLVPEREPRSFRQWVTNKFGARLFDIFFKTYTEKVWGMSCDDISADWAAQRIKGLDLGKAIMDAMKRSLGLKRKPASGAVIKTLIDTFHYPRLGPGMMWEAAARQIEAQGGKIVMGARVDRLVFDPGRHGWTVHASGRRLSVAAQHVISSAPLRELVASISPQPRCRAHADALAYRDFLTVALIIDEPDLFPDNWIYIHEPGVKVGRIQNFKSWSPAMVPDPTRCCIGLEYFCFEGDGLWSATDGELIALATAELAQLGIVAREKVVGGAVVRQQKAYPVYDDSYRDHVAAIAREVEARYPGLHLVGRNGMHKYNNQDHAMMTAMLTVENILAGRRIYDVWNVNEDAEYHEAGVSGAAQALKSERLVPVPIKA